MRRWFVLLFIVLLPLQVAWSAASGYCQHETGEQQTHHFGHHFHVHEGGEKKSTALKLMADADCATCHAVGTPAITMKAELPDFSATSTAALHVSRPHYSSALARAPDRPQWLRLV